MPTPNESTTKYIDAATRLLDPSHRELAPAVGDLGFSSGQVKGVDVGARTITALVSTPNPDRYEEIVDPKAFEKWLPVFKTNPVFLAGHKHVGFDSASPTVIGSWVEMQVTSEGLVGTCKFARTALAEEYWQLYVDGHMKAFSVGWMTHAWEIKELEVAPGIKKKIRVFTEVELIEVSAVAVPANREALVRAASLVSRNSGDPLPVLEVQTLDDDLIKAMAKTMTEMMEKATDKMIKNIDEQFTEALDPGPGSQLHMLISDVVECMQANRAGNSNQSPNQLDHVTPKNVESFDSNIDKLFTPESEQ